MPSVPVTCHRLPDGTIYYPLYATEADANAHSTDGQSHNHTVGSVVYHMPDNINGTLFHGQGSCADCADADHHVGENGTCEDSDIVVPPATTTTTAAAGSKLLGMDEDWQGILIIIFGIVPTGLGVLIILNNREYFKRVMFNNNADGQGKDPVAGGPSAGGEAAVVTANPTPESNLLHRSQVLSHHV